MKLFFSGRTGGFYSSDIHQAIPDDAVEITQAEHEAALNEQSTGKKIIPGKDGKPVAVAVEASQPSAVQIDAMRASAYKSEADPLFFKAQRGEATMDEWKAKVAEIKARFPSAAAPA